MQDTREDDCLLILGKELDSRLPRRIGRVWLFGLVVYVSGVIALLIVNAAGVRGIDSQRWHIVFIFGIASCCLGLLQRHLFRRFVNRLPPRALIILGSEIGREVFDGISLFMLFWVGYFAQIVLVPGLNVLVLMTLAGALGMLTRTATVLEGTQGVIQFYSFWFNFRPSRIYGTFEFSHIQTSEREDDDGDVYFRVELVDASNDVDPNVGLLSFRSDKKACEAGRRIAGFLNLPFASPAKQ